MHPAPQQLLLPYVFMGLHFARAACRPKKALPSSRRFLAQASFSPLKIGMMRQLAAWGYLLFLWYGKSAAGCRFLTPGVVDYPQKLWAKLLITLCTSPQTRTSTGLAGGVQKMPRTSPPSPATPQAWPPNRQAGMPGRHHGDWGYLLFLWYRENPWHESFSLESPP
jgi:hypothetical protein